MKKSVKSPLFPSGHAFSLPEAEVHIWFAPLNLEPDQLTQLSGFLSDNECSKAEGFHFIRDQQRYIAARGILRDVLCHYLAAQPDQLIFSYGAYGKPAIDQQASMLHTSLQFNLSYSQDRAICAIACGRAVGIDIQYMEPDIDVLEIAVEYFSPRERAALFALPRGLYRERFYRWWSRKEAYLKACGVGLAFGMEGIELMFDRGAQLFIDPLNVKASALSWHLEDLAVHPEYTATLAVAGRNESLRFLHWDGTGMGTEITEPQEWFRSRDL